MIHPKARLRPALAAACALALLAGAVAPRPLAAQEGANAVQDVTLADVALPLGGMLLRAPRLTASGTRLSRDDLAAILKPDSPEPWPARLARLDAASLSAPVLVSEHAGPGGSRQTVTYRDVVARDVRAGRIGELTAAGAALAVTGGPNPGSGTYGRLRASDLDLAALSRLGLQPGDGQGPVLRVYGAVEVADVTYSDAGGTTVKIARLAGRDLGARQVTGGWDRALDLATAGPADRRASAGAAADLIAAAAPGSLELRGLSVSDADPRGPLLVEVGRAAYGGPGPDAGTAAGLVLEDLSLARGSVRGRIGRLALAGLSLAPTVAALRALAAAPAPGPDDAGPALTQAELRRLAPTLGGVTLSDLSVDLPQDAVPPAAPPPGPPQGAAPGPQPSAGTNFAASAKSSSAKPADTGPPAKAAEPKPGDPLLVTVAPPPRLALRQAALTFGPWRDGVPGSARLALSGLTLPAGLAAGLPLVGALPAYGYRDLALDAVADASLDEGSRELVLRDLAVSGRDIGSVRLAGTLGGIGPELFSGSLPAATMLMFSGAAKTLDLTVENSGLFERFLAAQARDLSLKPDELRREYVTASLLGVPVILGNTPAARAIGAALGQFVTKPGRLALRARARDPAGVGFIELGAARSPAAVLDRFDVDAKAN